MKKLVPQFAPVDFEEASVSDFRRVFGDVIVNGCWFHYVQSSVKRIHKLGLKDQYVREANVQDITLLGLSLLLVGEKSQWQVTVNDVSLFANKLRPPSLCRKTVDSELFDIDYV